MAEATVEQRRAVVERKYERELAQATITMQKIFPQAPAKEIEAAVKRAYLKSSGRVGRTSSLTAEQKATLAMIAHIRHSKTFYDQLLRTGVGRSEARERVEQYVTQAVNMWRGKQSKTTILNNKIERKPRTRPALVPQELSTAQSTVTLPPTNQIGHAKSSQSIKGVLRAGEASARGRAIEEGSAKKTKPKPKSKSRRAIGTHRLRRARRGPLG